MSQNNQPTLESFLKDVKDHQIEILKDDGVYRHLKFSRPNTSNMSFSIVTWPGYLAYTGDMGDYVFTRVNDMLTFFRSDNEKLEISPQYWAEKCVAQDKADGLKRYDPDIFKQVVRERVANHLLEDAGFDFNRSKAKSLIDAVKEDVLAYAEDDEYRAREAANEFKHDDFQFHDFWEHDLKDYTYRFIWCCYALVWGAKKYDEIKNT